MAELFPCMTTEAPLQLVHIFLCEFTNNTLYSYFIVSFCCHNPNDNTTQQNLNTVVGLNQKMTVQAPPPQPLPPPPQKFNGSIQVPKNNTYWPQLDIT